MQHEPPPEDEWPPEEEDRRPAIIKPTWVRRVRAVALRHWQPRELAPPAVDPDLDRLTAIELSAEVLRHSILSLEYWLSPGGRLREWIRFNLRIATIIAVPALLVVPLITHLLRQIREWVALVIESTSSFIMFPLSALLIVGLVSVLIHLARAISIRRQQYRQQQQHYYQ